MFYPLSKTVYWSLLLCIVVDFSLQICQLLLYILRTRGPNRYTYTHTHTHTYRTFYPRAEMHSSQVQMCHKHSYKYFYANLFPIHFTKYMSKIAMMYNKHIFRYIRNDHTLFQIDYIICHSHWDFLLFLILPKFGIFHLLKI